MLNLLDNSGLCPFFFEIFIFFLCTAIVVLWLLMLWHLCFVSEESSSSNFTILWFDHSLVGCIIFLWSDRIQSPTSGDESAINFTRNLVKLRISKKLFFPSLIQDSLLASGYYHCFFFSVTMWLSLVGPAQNSLNFLDNKSKIFA